MPGKYHTVKECEYLRQIATSYGFRDPDIIWNHPNNAKLKAKRKYHNVLNPGDILFIPDKDEKNEARATTRLHTFVVPTRTIPLKIKVRNLDDNPVGGADCNLRIEKALTPTTTDGDGMLTKPDLPLTARNGELKIDSDTLPLGQWDVTLHIGCLDSEDTRAGQQARLNNLGYFAGYALDNDKQFQWAVEEFQCDHIGPKSVTGVCDTATQARLIEVHGC